MKKSRHSTEQIIRILREADAGATTEKVCRSHFAFNSRATRVAARNSEQPVERTISRPWAKIR